MDNVIPVRATVRPDTNWIYKGLTLNVLDWREPCKIEVELGIGRQYKLDLRGTEFEKKYSYTYIHEGDLNVEFEPMNEENAKRYRRLETIAKFNQATNLGGGSASRELLISFLEWQEQNGQSV